MAFELVADTAASAAGGAVDVTDRAGRALGIVSITGQPIGISAAALPLPAGAATEATLAAASGKLPSVLVGDRMKVDGSGVTQPVSLAAGVDVTDRAGRALGVISGTVDVTELPAAAALTDTDANPTTTTVAAVIMGRNAGGTLERIRALGDNADGIAVGATGRLATIARLTGYNGTTWDLLRAADGHLYGDHPATLSVIVTGGANAIATATLPAVAGQFHYITHLSIRRVATAALAGGLILTVTTTNLGGRAWRSGNQMSITIGSSEPPTLIDVEYSHALKSAVVNTATTIVCPAAGTAVSWHIVVDYYAAP